MFDLSKFRIPRTPAFWRVKGIRAIIDGNDPLAGLKVKHVDESSLVARRGDERVLMVIVPHHRESDRFFVTTYWGAKPQEVLESLRGTRKFLDLSGDWTYSGGPEDLAVEEVYARLARLAEGNQDP